MAGAPVEICFSLDTACSIGIYLNNMKEQVKLLIKKLHAKIHGVRFAIFAHGDYCSTPYITKHINFSENVDDLCEWLFMLKLTTGRDVDGCYELVLKEVQSLSWTPGSKRALVMIGNADPHEPGYAYGTHTCNIDWRDETSKLMQMVCIRVKIRIQSRGNWKSECARGIVFCSLTLPTFFFSKY